jgi:hypothetical protein
MDIADGGPSLPGGVLAIESSARLPQVQELWKQALKQAQGAATKAIQDDNTRVGG